MLFVSGLMGPYMSPIPANASLAMVFSFFVAMTITPWLLMKVAGKRFENLKGDGHGEHDPGPMGRFYKKIATRLLQGRENSKRFLLYVGLATLAALALFATKSVRVKLLPFDNKSEIAVVVDLPRSAPLEATDRLLTAAAERLRDLPELTSIQSYAGTAAPFNFNGLVRHYYLRNAPYMGDLAVNLLPKDERKRASHAIALDIRKRLERAGTARTHVNQSRRGAAWTAGAFDAARRDLWTDSRGASRDRDQSAPSVRSSRFHRRRGRQFWRAPGAAALFDRPGVVGVLRRRAAGGL